MHDLDFRNPSKSKSANLEGSLTLLFLVFCVAGTGSTFRVGVLLTGAFPGLEVWADITGSRGIRGGSGNKGGGGGSK